MVVNSLTRFLYLLPLISMLCLFPLASYASPTKTVETNSANVLEFNWLDNPSTLTIAQEGLTFISTISTQGLNPEDYQSTLLSQQFQLATTPLARQQFNRLFTQNLLSLIHDLKVGRQVAIDADPDWFIPQKHFDAKAFLQHALDSQHLQAHLNQLIPTDAEYQTLVKALARYRHYDSQGGWPIIPPTPKLKVGAQHPNIPLIQSRLAFEDSLFAMTHTVTPDLYDPLMEQAVKRFQARYHLKVDGVIGKNTFNALNKSAKSHVQLLEVNLERRRWMPDDLGERYVLINLADFRLRAIEHGQVQLAMNVVVGNKKRQTPSFSAQMSHMVFNPYWHVPRKLARLDLLPKQQQDPNYFYQHGIRVFSVEGGQKIEHNADNINWQSYNKQNPLPYTFRQNPGEYNSLGRIKFMFKNPWAIYLHDSPSKSLFNDTQRALSSGCIRVADPINLAQFSLRDHQQQNSVLERIDSERNHGLQLKTPLNIFAVYFTVSVEDNNVLFSPDVYQRDQRLIKSLY